MVNLCEIDAGTPKLFWISTITLAISEPVHYLTTEALCDATNATSAPIHYLEIDNFRRHNVTLGRVKFLIMALRF